MTDKPDIPLQLFNTASRALEPFRPLEAGKVSLYCCGPTVYHYAHIGNMRTYVFEDVLRRTLERWGYDVKHVMNITDVGHLQSDADSGDDKMAVAASRERKSPWDIAKFYEAEFFRHSEMLRIARPAVVCRATDHIAEMIAMVDKLVRDGYAYASQGNVYFDVAKFGRYTEFAGLKLDAQAQSDRVEHDERKRNQADFALWFSQSKFPNQIMKWDSPWGVGFPGWHIECSAMATKYLGEHFDIHCGGIDHIPVHHTNEIAQSECSHGHKWVNYWLHGEFLNVDAGKMSKSKGDTLTVDTLVADGYDPLDYRYLLLTAHYRSELRFSYAALSHARTAHQGLRERMREWKAATSTETEIGREAQSLRNKFWEAVANDLHMPTALAVAWAAAKSDAISPGEKYVLWDEFDSVFGLGLSEHRRRELSTEQAALLKEREAVRAAKNWAESDRLRDVLAAQGILVKDTKAGTDWSWAI
jgi:cysteinyl-tRNA synthetase